MKKNITILILLFICVNASYSQILIDNGGISVFEFVPDGRTWDHNIITYFFENGTNDILDDNEQTGIRDALELWSNNSNLAFLEVSNIAAADIVFNWGTGDHDDGFPFDGANGILAHGFYPPPNGIFAGDVHFDDDETWTLNIRSNSSQPIDLVTIAAHEIGHALGLRHSEVPDALMYAYYNGSHRYLDSDDINGINSLYPDRLISGPNEVCSSNTTYTISDRPTGTTILWTHSPNIQYVSGQGTDNYTVKASGNGTGWVTATISSPGFDDIVLTENVWVGVPSFTIIGEQQYEPLGPGIAILVYSPVNDPSSQYVTNVDWSFTGPLDYVTGDIYKAHTRASRNEGVGFIYAEAFNQCGSYENRLFYEVEGWMMSLQIYPNPVQDQVEVSITDNTAELEKTSKKEVYQVAVYDINGLPVFNKNLYSKKFTLNTGFLRKGSYVIRVYGNNNVASKTFLKE